MSRTYNANKWRTCYFGMMLPLNFIRCSTFHCLYSLVVSSFVSVLVDLFMFLWVLLLFCLFTAVELSSLCVWWVHAESDMTMCQWIYVRFTLRLWGLGIFVMYITVCTYHSKQDCVFVYRHFHYMWMSVHACVEVCVCCVNTCCVRYLTDRIPLNNCNGPLMGLIE